MTDQSDWVMVPREPTKAMRWAGDGAAETCINDDPCGMAGKHIWADMIAAAPKPPTTPPDEMVALELAARNFPDGPGAKERLAIAALNYARAASAAITEGREG